MKSAILVVTLCLSPFSAAFALDPFSLSLQSSDLAHLQVGEATTIDVVLAGLPPGATLDYLAATIVFDVKLLGTPSIVAGSIISDATGFTSTAQPGLADALYDSLAASSGDAVSQAGILFSLTVTPLAPGRGTFAFGFTDAIGVVAGGVAIDGVLASPPTHFVVEVPEPSTFSLVVLTFAILSWRVRRKAT